MRELILKRIEAIRTFNNGFQPTVQRWQNFSHGSEKKHLHEIKFEELEDSELLFLFERLIRRANQLM